MRMKRIRKSVTGEDRGAIDRIERHREHAEPRVSRMTSSHAIVLGMIFVVLTAALLPALKTCRKQPSTSTTRNDGMAATVETIRSAPSNRRSQGGEQNTARPRRNRRPRRVTSCRAAAESKTVDTSPGLENDEGTFLLTEPPVQMRDGAKLEVGVPQETYAHVDLVDAVGLNLRNTSAGALLSPARIVERDMVHVRCASSAHAIIEEISNDSAALQLSRLRSYSTSRRCSVKAQMRRSPSSQVKAASAEVHTFQCGERVIGKARVGMVLESGETWILG